MSNDERVMVLLREAKQLARQYYALTGKPLGVTGEIAEYEAARILGVELTPARQAGYDAIERTNGSVKRLQIKGRCLQENSKPGQRLGSIRPDKDWDAVLMVLLDHNFEALEIYEAQRSAILAALTVPGSKARNERGALSVTKFKAIGQLRWRRSAVGQSGGVYEASVALPARSIRLSDDSSMSQDRSSGAAANEWGRKTARQIALEIGATMQGRSSNEALLNGHRVVIKCAAAATDSVGVTYKMLKKLDSVIGAFQLPNGSFELWALSPKQFEAAMRETRSRGSAAGKVALVRRHIFMGRGKSLGRIRVRKRA